MKKQLLFRGQSDRKRTVLLSVFLLFGIGMGLLLAGQLSMEEIEALREYVVHRRDTLCEGTWYDHGVETLWLYFRGPLLLILMRCHVAMVPLVLALCTARAMELSFAVSTFAAAMGREGLLLSLGLLGIRCLFTLPLTLYLAGGVIKAAVEPTADNRAMLWRRALCSAVYLLIGAVLEMTVSPLLLRYIL